MKRNKIASVVRSLLMSVWMVSVLCGCENESAFSEIEVNPGEESSEPIPISVSVSSIEEYYGGAVTRGGSTSESIRQPLDSLVDSGYDIVTTYESLPADNRVQTRATMANMRFRVLAYKNNSVTSANFVGQCQFQTNGSGIATSMQGAWLILPGTYTFVCYSNGTNDDIPVFSGSDTSLSISQNTDFMTCTKANVAVKIDASGKFTLSGIQFNRMMAQLDIWVQTKGFPSNNNISSCAATVTGLSNTASWGIGTADLTVAGTSGSASFTFPSVNNADIHSTSIRVFPQSSRSLYVTLPTLRVNNGGNYDNKVTNVAAPNRQFVRSGNYRITLKVEPNSIPACANNWAKANLSGNGTIAASQTDRGALFGWNTLSTATGANNGGNYDYNQDPCRAVPPVGTWYTPSKDQLTNLKDCSPGLFTNGGKYFASNAIFLPAAGCRLSDGTMSYVGTDGLYWSRAPYGGDAYSLDFYSSYAGISSYYSRYYGFSVRCVKGE